jgi:hypothetical protein
MTLSKYFTVNTAAIGTTLTVGVIPAGMRVKNVEVYTTALGASVTLAAGVPGSTALFIAQTSVASATKLAMTDTIAGGASTRDEANNRLCVLTTAGAITAASNQNVWAVVTLVPDYD